MSFVRSSAARAALPLRFLGLGLVGLGFVGLGSGCPAQGRSSTVRFEVAPEGACGGPAAELRVGCVEVEVCESDAPDTCVAVAPVGGPYPALEDRGVMRIVVPSVGGQLRFDARTELGVLYDIDVVAYGTADEGTSRSSVVAAGHVSRVSLETGQSTVWLYPTDTWSCPGATSTTLRRAFHQSVALSNGDALIIGGVTFERNATGLTLVAGTPTARLVPGEESVMVYDAQTEQLLPVTVSDGDAAQLARVMFHARWIERSTSGDAGERVRLYGGVTGTSTLAFSVSSGGQYPVRVGDTGAQPATTLDILYHPSTHSLEIQPRTGSLEAVIESERTPLPAGRPTPFAALVGGVTSAPEVVTSFGSAAESVTASTMLPSARRGATLSRFGARGFLVYGGNTADMGGDDTSPQALQRALLLSATGTMTPVTLPSALARSGLHTASVIDDDTVLFVGGLALDGGAVGMPTFPVVRAVRLDAAGSGLEVLDTSGTGETSTERIYHSATIYRGRGDSQSTVIVAGGSTRMGTSQFQPLATSYRYDPAGTPPVAALPSLEEARFGHSSVLLRGGRVLVTGGLRRGVRAPGCTTDCEESTSLYLVETPELLVVRDLPAPTQCDIASIDAGPPPADAARRDAPMSVLDAGPTGDAGPTADAGVADDAGPTDDAAMK